MKRLARMLIIGLVAACLAAVLLEGPLRDQLAELSYLAQIVPARKPAGRSADPDKRSTEMLVAMHAHQQAELEETVARIRDEFGVEVSAAQFSSHHVARDYLARLRLAEQAEALGFSVDPHAFGDDACMRRHIEALAEGGSTASNALRPARNDESTAFGSWARSPRDCIFVYGKKYCRNHEGRYVRADGTLLETSLLLPPQRGRMLAQPKAENRSVPPTDGLSAELDELLDLIRSE